MPPGVALATFDTASHHFMPGQDKTLLNFSLAASLLALLDAHFQLGPFQVLVAGSKTSELLTSGAAPV